MNDDVNKKSANTEYSGHTNKPIRRDIYMTASDREWVKDYTRSAIRRMGLDRGIRVDQIPPERLATLKVSPEQLNFIRMKNREKEENIVKAFREEIRDEIIKKRFIV